MSSSCQENESILTLFYILLNQMKMMTLPPLLIVFPKSKKSPTTSATSLWLSRLSWLNLFSFLSISRSSNQDRLSDLKIIDEMLKVYDRRATPTNKIGQPTRVICELFIRSFGSISEKTMVSTY